MNDPIVTDGLVLLVGQIVTGSIIAAKLILEWRDRMRARLCTTCPNHWAIYRDRRRLPVCRSCRYPELKPLKTAPFPVRGRAA